jgi:diadenylate cyclase
MEYINKGIAEFILFITREAGTFWENLVLLQFSWPQVIIDIALVSIVFYYIFILLKGSRAIHILIGLLILAFIFLLSKALQLFATGWLLDRFLTLILVAIPVIFQQELRRGLEKLGQTRIFSSSEVGAADILIGNLVDVSVIMAKRKVGALVVLKKDVSLNEYAETGVPINGKISKELILSIFFPKTPLHDGAIIIEGDKVVAAACVLPHSYKFTADRSLGTRHKAAIGLAENTDAHVIVISEERGTISYAHNGRLEHDITPEKLQKFLEEFYAPKTKKIKRGKKSLFKKRKL